MGPHVNKIQTPISLLLCPKNSPPRDIFKAFSPYFQHLPEALVEEVYEIMQSEFIYKKDGLRKFATPRNRLADPSYGSAIKTFQSNLGYQRSFGSSATWECDISCDGVGRPETQYVIYHMLAICI